MRVLFMHRRLVRTLNVPKNVSRQNCSTIMNINICFDAFFANNYNVKANMLRARTCE